MRNAFKILVGESEGMRPLGRSRRRWEDSVRVDLREKGWDVVDWIHLAQDWNLWGGGPLVNAIMNLRVP